MEETKQNNKQVPLVSKNADENYTVLCEQVPETALPDGAVAPPLKLPSAIGHFFFIGFHKFEEVNRNGQPGKKWGGNCKLCF